DSIALAGNVRDGVPDRFPETWLVRIQLQHIRPGRKVWVPATGNDGCSNGEKGRGIFLGVFRSPANEVLGVLPDPGMIRRHMIRNEIEQQPHPSFRECLPGYGQTTGSSELLVNFVATYAIWRTHVVGRGKVRKRPAEIAKETLIPVGDGDSRGAALPNTHQPHGIATVFGDRVPFAVWHAA